MKYFQIRLFSTTTKKKKKKKKNKKKKKKKKNLWQKGVGAISCVEHDLIYDVVLLVIVTIKSFYKQKGTHQ